MRATLQVLFLRGSAEEVLASYSLIMYEVILLRFGSNVHNRVLTISYENIKDYLLHFLNES